MQEGKHPNGDARDPSRFLAFAHRSMKCCCKEKWAKGARYSIVRGRTHTEEKPGQLVCSWKWTKWCLGEEVTNLDDGKVTAYTISFAHNPAVHPEDIDVQRGGHYIHYRSAIRPLVLPFTPRIGLSNATWVADRTGTDAAAFKGTRDAARNSPEVRAALGSQCMRFDSAPAEKYAEVKASAQETHARKVKAA